MMIERIKRVIKGIKQSWTDQDENVKSKDTTEEKERIDPLDFMSRFDKWDDLIDPINNSLQKTVQDFNVAVEDNDGNINIVQFADLEKSGIAMDSAGSYASTGSQTIPRDIAAWYSLQGFIGHQMCAVMAQNWLIDKACTKPAKAAIRNGYEILVTDGTDVDTNILEKIKKLDNKYKVKDNCIEFIRFKRIYGIRIALFEVDSDDNKYY
jgi:hypothetical protein